MQEIRELKETAGIIAMAFVWVLTIIIAVVLVRYSIAIVNEITSVVRQLL